MLLGVTAQQVTLIKEFEEGEFPEDPKSQDGEVGSSGFKDVFKSSLKTWGFSSGGKGRKRNDVERDQGGGRKKSRAEKSKCFVC